MDEPSVSLWIERRAKRQNPCRVAETGGHGQQNTPRRHSGMPARRAFIDRQRVGKRIPFPLPRLLRGPRGTSVPSPKPRGALPSTACCRATHTTHTSPCNYHTHSHTSATHSLPKGPYADTQTRHDTTFADTEWKDECLRGLWCMLPLGSFCCPQRWRRAGVKRRQANLGAW